MNFGVKQAKTKYVFMTTPDILLNNNTLNNLLIAAKKLNDNFVSCHLLQSLIKKNH